ncbi:ABC transporter permease [Litoribacillus peritrichatus]|uniref:PhnE/PtxC family ABC transporter permease n=1 Tax=Litoribacillus peritrichatus TaxID=718191 RepID=UPI0031D5506A
MPDNSAAKYRRVSLLFAVSALICLPFANLNINTLDPWTELGQIGYGFLTPDFSNPALLLEALGKTLAFAFQGVMLGVIFGLLLALFYQKTIVRQFSAFIRAIHEIFWALIFIQITGLSSATGVLAIAIPYTGIFAKIFGELLSEVDHKPLNAIVKNTKTLNSTLFIRLPLAWKHIKTYTCYRLECGIRSSAILGFIGLPTLGFHMETFYKQGMYDQGAAILYVFFLLIGTSRFWLKSKLIPLYVLASFWLLPWSSYGDWSLLMRFITEDIVPAPLKQPDLTLTEKLHALGSWGAHRWHNEIMPGILNTVVLSQISLIFTGVISLILFPWISHHFLNKLGRASGNTVLVVARSTPEYLLAFIGLLIFGPSMLPGILALALHNGAIVAHLIGLYSQSIKLRDDASSGLNRYFFEILPRIYRQFLAFLLYRWEVIMRETAILGILGIPTLGFYIDSAFEEIRFDRAILLILVAALLNILVDQIATWSRTRLHIQHRPESL